MADRLELLLTLVGGDDTEAALNSTARVLAQIARRAISAQSALRGLDARASNLAKSTGKVASAGDRMASSSDKAYGAFDRLNGKIQEVIGNQEKLNNLRSVRAAAGGIYGGGGRGSGRSRSFDPNARGSFSINDIQRGHDRIIRAQQAYARQQARQSPYAGPNGQFIIPKAMPRQSSTMQRIRNAVMSTRFGVGGGGFSLHPLIGRTMAAAGPEGLAAAALAFAAYEGAKKIYELAESAAAAANSFERIRMGLGSSSNTTARLTGLASAIGLSPGDVGGLSQSINARISSDGLARASAAGMGVYQLPRPYGSADEGKNLLKIAEGIRAIGDEAQAITTARILGAEALLPLRNLSKSTFDKLKGDADLKSSIFDKDFTQNAAEFQAASSRLAGAVENLLAVAGKPAMEKITNFFNNLATGLNRIADFLDKHQGLIQGATDTAFGPLRAMFGGTMDPAGPAVNPQAALDDNSQALDRNTQATQAAAQAFAQWHNGYYGRGERGDRALPSGMRTGEALRQTLASGGIILGQF